MWFSFTVIKRNLWSPTDNNQSCTGEMKCHMVSGELTYGCSSHVGTIQGTGKVQRNISNMLTLLIISYNANTASAGGASSFRERLRKKGSRSLESIFSLVSYHLMTFDDALLLIFDLSKAQSLGLFRLVDQPRVRRALTCTSPIGDESRPMRQSWREKINFHVCGLSKKIKCA